MHTNAIMVLNGTAPDECLPQIKKLSRNVVVNIIPGYRKPVLKGKTK